MADPMSPPASNANVTPPLPPVRPLPFPSSSAGTRGPPGPAIRAPPGPATRGPPGPATGGAHGPATCPAPSTSCSPDTQQPPVITILQRPTFPPGCPSVHGQPGTPADQCSPSAAPCGALLPSAHS
eukprot:89564-Chlamydomonas_euryale.AAC.4